MAVMSNDAPRTALGAGTALAVASATCFGLAGPLASGLLTTGWSPGAVVLARIALAALVVAPLAAHGLPPQALAGGGLLAAAIGLALLGAVGVLPLRASTDAPAYAGTAVAWWLPLLGLGVVTAAIAYVAGIAASRRLGSRVASFVAL